MTDSEEDLSLVGWTGGLILFAGLFDMMDGRVARLGNMSSTFGALYDSVLDRYSELFTLFGISYYLILQGYFVGSIITFLALIGSLMVSYVRASGVDQSGSFVLRYIFRLHTLRPDVDPDCSSGNHCRIG